MMPEITKLVVSKRGQIIDVKQENDACAVVGKMPVAEMLGWSSDLRSATEGRGVSALKDQMFELMPLELQANVIRNIRSRKPGSRSALKASRGGTAPAKRSRRDSSQRMLPYLTPCRSKA